ncbi:MAG: hypothetical protein ABJC66_11380 [Gammaproteobacteria bacterium]
MRKWIRLWGMGIALSAGTPLAVQPACAQAAAIGTFDLVTDSEAEKWTTIGPTEPTDFETRDLSEDNGRPTCRSTANNDADNPQIKITEPAIVKPLIMPIDIDLKFIPAGSAPIRPETFRVCYIGLVTMDITKRITDRATVSAQGLRVTGARLPRGHHRLVLLVADERGRLARHEAVFNVL